MSIADEARSSWPVICSSQIVSINEFQLVEDLRLERIMIHGINYNSSLPIESVRIFVHIDNNHEFFHNVHTDHVLG